MTTDPTGSAPFGPVELIALAFPGSEVPEPVLAQLAALSGSAQVRVVDVVAVQPRADGFDIVEVGELGGALEPLVADLAAQGLAAEHDLAEVAGSLAPGTSALVVVVEHVWARGLASAVRASGAVVVTAELVPAEVVNALAVLPPS